MDTVITLTQPVVMSYPQLFEARGFTNTDPNKKYSARLHLLKDSPDLIRLKDALFAVARERWPGRDLTATAFPLKNGDKVADEAPKKNQENCRGCVLLTTKSVYAPGLSYIENGQLISLQDDAARKLHREKFYPGVLVLAQVNCRIPPKAESLAPRVVAYLNMVCSLNTGERIGGKTSADVFKEYVGQYSAQNPTVAEPADDLGF